MSVVRRLRERAAEFPERPAILTRDRAITHGELYERVDRLSQAFRALGIEQGDRALAFLPNIPEAIECELACLQSGIVWITLTARLTWAEVRGVVASCRPKLLITDGTGLEKVRGGAAELPVAAPLPVVLVGSARSSGSGSPSAPLGYEALIRVAPARSPEVVIREEDPARLRYTSGTTGSAKAAVLPHRVYHASLDNLLRELPPVGEHDRALHVAPLTHGSGALVFPMLWGGGANLLLTRFEVEEVLDVIESARVTTLFTVPTILSRLVSSPSLDARDLRSLRSLIYGGAPMPESQLRAAVQKIGHAMMQIYGMTEAPWPITTLKQADHRLDGTKLGSAGRPTTVCSVCVTDECGKAVATNEVGEIRVRGRNVMQGYFEDEEATSAVLRDGWLQSGDLGYFDEDGYLYIVGRQKDVIISGGFNVYANEVEDALCSDPRVLEAAVVGVPDADWGETVVAFVVARPGAPVSPPELAALARSLLSSYKCPRHIEILEELPKNTSGKIQKRALARGFASRVDGSLVRE